MQGDKEGWRRADCEEHAVEDDMAGGDLGDGTASQPTLPSVSPATVAQSWSHAHGGEEEPTPPTAAAGPLKRGSLQGSGKGARTPFSTSTSSILGLYRPLSEGERIGAPWRRLTRTQSTADLSKDELRTRLQEVTEESEFLRCELEVARRYLEGKYEALKILQGQAILDKATGHTKSLLQKSEERAKALEKEVNGLQWEVTFNQVQLKNLEQSWQQKYDRVCTENRTLSDSLGGRVREVQELRAENAALNQQCVELVSMLSVREQKAFQGTKPPCGRGQEVTVLELGVLGACQCPGTREPCPCARTAASSRKQLLQLRHEVDSQRRRRDEALMMADAFRIAFEQQLRKRSDHFLLLADAHRIKSRPRKSEGANRSVVQKFRELLPSSTELQMSDDPADILHKLLDLLNDKEEALAHQRKVSLMLARSTEELERRLQPQDLHRTEELERRLQPQDLHRTEELERRLQPQDLHCTEELERRLQPQDHDHHCNPPPNTFETHLHRKPQPNASETHLHRKPQPNASETHLHRKPQPNASETKECLHCKPPPNVSEAQLHCKPPPNVSEAHLQECPHCKPQPNASEAHLQEHLHFKPEPPETTCDSRYQRQDPSCSESKQQQQQQSIAASVPKPLQPGKNCACGNTRDAPY